MSMNYVKVTEKMNPTSITMGAANQFFITTRSILPQNPGANTGPLLCLAVSEFTYSAVGGVWTGSYANTYFNNVNYPFGQVKYKDFGGGVEGYFICSNTVTGSTDGILFTRRLFYSILPENIIY